MYKFKYGFSMVELMLLLLIASLILAATVPVITKKHLHLPFSTNHGSYICYYDQEGKLHEDRKSGKITQKSLAGYPREVHQCVFEPPAKAVMFQVTAIGGGGGGGDAGYEYIEPDTVTESAKEIQPFELSNQNLIDIGVSNNNEAINEVLGYSGLLWGFAQGADSGDAGYIWYTDVTERKAQVACPADQIKYETKTGTRNITTEYEFCVSNSAKKQITKGNRTIKGDIYDCYKDDSLVGGYVTFRGETSECEATVTETTNNTTCTYVDNKGNTVAGPTYKYDCKLSHKVHHDAVYHPEGYQYFSGYGPKPEVPCTNPCQYLGQTNCNQGPCYGDAEPIYKSCPNPNSQKINACKIKDAWDEYVEDDNITQNGCTGKSKSICTSETGSNTSVESWTDTAPSDIKYKTTSGNGVTCIKRTDGDSTFQGNATLEYEYQYPAGCNVEGLEASYGEYSVQRYPSSLDGYYKGGHGKFCRTPIAFPGGYFNGITYNINFPDTKPKLVTDINQGLKSSGLKSFCGTSNFLGLCGPSIGNVYTDTYAEFTVSTQPDRDPDGNTYTATIRSNSSQTPATGKRLKQATKTIYEFDRFDANGKVVTKPVTYYYDEIDSAEGQNGTDGTCSVLGDGFDGENNYDTWHASTDEFPDVTGDCRKGKTTPRVGYCLLHNYDIDAVNSNHSILNSKAELNGVFKYFDKYQTGTLKRGLPGQSGEYKTIILRSMKDIDTTITIGRGGTGATIKSGDDGAHGDSTSFGTLLLAKGGDGGAGNQLINERLRLQKYDGNATGADFDMVRRCFNDQLQEGDNQATCNAWKADPDSLLYYKNTAGDSGEPPVRKSAGGIFNFILAALGLNNNETVMDIMEFSGRGGQGGGVQHFCWAGQYILNFERRELYKSSIYFEDKLPSGHEDDVPANHKIPIGCKAAYDHVQAGDGYDGALIITW